jgi:hypothetical protein
MDSAAFRCLSVRAGYSDFEIFFFNYIPHTVLDQKNNFMNILEKAFFYIFSGIFLNLGFESKNIENGTS